MSTSSNCPTQDDIDQAMFFNIWSTSTVIGLSTYANWATVEGVKFEALLPQLELLYTTIMTGLPCQYHVAVAGVFKQYLDQLVVGIALVVDASPIDIDADIDEMFLTPPSIVFTVFRQMLLRLAAYPEKANALITLFSTIFRGMTIEYLLNPSVPNQVAKFSYIVQLGLLSGARLSGNPPQEIINMQLFGAYDKCFNFTLPCTQYLAPCGVCMGVCGCLCTTAIDNAYWTGFTGTALSQSLIGSLTIPIANYEAFYEPYRTFYDSALNSTTKCNRDTAGSAFDVILTGAVSVYIDGEETPYDTTLQYAPDVLEAYDAFLSRTSCSKQLTETIAFLFRNYWTAYMTSIETLDTAVLDTYISEILTSAIMVAGNPSSLEDMFTTYTVALTNSLAPCKGVVCCQ